jgi:hypothetical protein
VVGVVSIIGGSQTRGNNKWLEPVLWRRDQGRSKACAQPILTAEVTIAFAVTAKGIEGSVDSCKLAVGQGSRAI